MASTFQVAALSRYRRVISLLDGDEAGREGARLLHRVLRRRVVIADIGAGDAGDATADHIRSDLESVVRDARSSPSATAPSYTGSAERRSSRP